MYRSNKKIRKSKCIDHPAYGSIYRMSRYSSHKKTESKFWIINDSKLYGRCCLKDKKWAFILWSKEKKQIDPFFTWNMF